MEKEILTFMPDNEDILAYARKHYPIGTEYIHLDNNGIPHARERSTITRDPRVYGGRDCIEGGHGFIYCKNKWAEIINEVKEEEKMETNLLELIRLFPELPTDYTKELVVEALKVKNGNISDLSKFINTVKNTITTNYDIIPGNRPDNKADYVWRKIYDFKNNQMETQKLSRQGLKEIHSVACDAWKEILEKYGANNPLEDYIELTQPQVDTMFNSCTKEQLPIVSKYLKQCNIKDIIKGIDDIQLQTVSKGLVKVRVGGEFDYKSFTLHEDYDWKIQQDGYGFKCLIPTKKK